MWPRPQAGDSSRSGFPAPRGINVPGCGGLGARAEVRQKQGARGHSPAGPAGQGVSKAPHPHQARAESRARGLGAKAKLPPTRQLPSGPCAPQLLRARGAHVYFAIWGDNKAFNEVIISPAMLHEHLPYVVMEGLNKVSPRAPGWLGLRPHVTHKGATLPGHSVGQGAHSFPGLHTRLCPHHRVVPWWVGARRHPGTCP